MSTDKNEYIKLENQLCFALYVCSKEIIKKYTALLQPLGLTYTSYIILLALYQKDNVTVKELGNVLFLDSGTLTPTLKKLEKLEYIKRTRAIKDERTVIITLTDTALNLKEEIMLIPEKMYNSLGEGKEELPDLLKQLHKLIKILES